jgi:hypothetical protein
MTPTRRTCLTSSPDLNIATGFDVDQPCHGNPKKNLCRETSHLASQHRQSRHVTQLLPKSFPNESFPPVEDRFTINTPTSSLDSTDNPSQTGRRIAKIPGIRGSQRPSHARHSVDNAAPSRFVRRMDFREDPQIAYQLSP